MTKAGIKSGKEKNNGKDVSSVGIADSVILQLILKVFTFGLNNWIARTVSSAYLGIVVVRFEFILTVVNVLAREGVRRALLRSKNSKGAWISVLFAGGVSLIVSFVAALSVPQEIDEAQVGLFYRSIALFAVSAVIEAATEAPLVTCLRNGKSRQRLWAESGALMIRIALIAGLLLRDAGQVSMASFIDIFARGQLAYSIALNALYWRQLSKDEVKETFTLPESDFWRLSTSLCAQNLFKFALSQGDMLVINAFASFSDQGVFAVVSNYGSLVLRLLFQPIEEASTTFFARERTSASAREYFCRTLKVLIYISCVFACFATFFTRPVVRFLLGRKWIESGEAVAALSAYCLLVATAGISGFLESFLHAVIDEKWLTWSRNWMLAFSVVYCALAVGLIKAGGAGGLILASALNFLMRAGLNAVIVDDYLKDIWSQSIPNKWALCAFGASLVNNSWAFVYFGPDRWVIRLVPASLAFFTVIAVTLRTDYAFFKSFLKVKKIK